MNQNNRNGSDGRSDDAEKRRQVQASKPGASKPGEKPGRPVAGCPQSAAPAGPVEEPLSLSGRQREFAGVIDHEQPESRQQRAVSSIDESHYVRLMRFQVVTQRLLDAQSGEDLFEIIHEIVANLVGCEEFGIFRIDEKCTLSLVSSCGIDHEALQRLPLGSSLIGRIALGGEPYFGGITPSDFRLSQESNLTACIPLKRHERLFGAIGIFRLLPQKTAGLEDEDKELLCLVGKLAAVVLLCTTALCRTVAIGARA